MSLRANAVANYVGQGWTTLIGLAFIPLYVRYLGLEAYGLIGIFAMLQSWLSLLDFGLTPAISREMARFTAGGRDPQSIRDLLRSVEVSTLCIAASLGIGIWASSAWLATEWLQAEKISPDVVADALAVMGMVIGLRLVENIYRSSIVGLQRQVALNIVTGAMATVRAGGAVAILAWIAPTISAFFLWQGFVSLLTVGVFGLMVHRALPPAPRRAQFSLDSLSGIRRFAGGTLLVTLLGFLLSQSDKVILSKLLTLSDFALYSLAYTVASTVRLLAQPIDQAVFPLLTQLYQRGDVSRLSVLYHKSTQYNAVLMGSVGVFLAVFGADLLALWMQDEAIARGMSSVLGILVLGMVLNGIMNGPYYLQMAAGWTDLLVRVNAVMVIVFVPMIYLLAERFGMVGAAVSWLLLNGIYVVTVARLMHKRLLQGQLLEWYTRDLILPLSAAVAVAVVLRILMPDEVGAPATVLLLSFALAGVVVASSLAARCVRRDLAGQLRLALGRAS